MFTTFNDMLKSLGFDSYGEYLASEHWRSVRERYENSDLPQRCTVCSKKRYQLHHKTYERLGCEELGDLVPLCHDCHRVAHRLNKGGVVRLANAHEALLALAGKSGMPVPKLTKANSTKRDRKKFNRLRRNARKHGNLIRSNSGSIVQSRCGYRARQCGQFCPLCGNKVEVAAKH